MVKINLRWLVQALSLLLGIYSFKKIFDLSKAKVLDPTTEIAAPIILWAAIFCLSFLGLMFTSYLKQRANFTLRNRIAFFERLVQIFGLENYKERQGVSDAKQRKRAEDRTT